MEKNKDKSTTHKVLTFLGDDTLSTKAYLKPGEIKEVYLQIHWQDDKTQDEYIGMVDVVYLKVTLQFGQRTFPVMLK